MLQNSLLLPVKFKNILLMKQKRNYLSHGSSLTIYALLAVMITGCSGSIGPEIAVYSSSIDGDRLKCLENARFKKDAVVSFPVITIDDGIVHQKIDGFGASFNEAGMICLNSLKEEVRDSVVRMLFDPETGAGFTLMKSPIAACDFASAGPWYSYNETPGDVEMKNFSIERDLKPDGLISFIKKAAEFGKFEIETTMDFAPDWMYFSLKPGEKHVKPEYYPALAKYYSKYLQAYADNGIKIDYLNLFNEAENHWYSNVTYKAIGEMIRDHVASQLKADGLTTKIQMGESCNRPEGIQKFPSALDDPEVRKHISTMTVHGYDWDKFSSLDELHARYPDIPIWQTEVCYAKVDDKPTNVPPGAPEHMPVYDFSDGEFWGNMIMNDMKHHVSAWIYWNMILDQNGGPWLVSVEHGDPDNNRQHSVVIINRETGEVTYTGLYYYLAHFSKFVRPGAERIGTSGGSEQLNFAAFRNEDGSIVLNIINNGDATSCKILWKGKMVIREFKPHSILTMKWTPEESV